MASAVVGLALLAVRTAPWSGGPPPGGDGPVLETGPTLDLGVVEPLRIDTLRNVLSVADAAQVGRGWVLLDDKSHRLHRWTAPDEPEPVGRRGDGPGELDRPALMDAGGGLVAVVDRLASRVDLFDVAGRYRERWSLVLGDCSFAQPVELLAAPGGSFVLLVRCAAPGRGVWSRLLEIEPGEGVAVVGEDAPGLRTEMEDLPVLARHRGSFLQGVNGSPCLHPVEGWARGPDLCHPRAEGPPLPDSLRAELEAFLGRVRRGRPAVAVPERLPPLSGASSTSGGSLVFRVPIPDGREALDILLGRRLHRLVSPAGTRVFPGVDRILVTRPLLAGTEVWTVVWPGEWPTQGRGP